MKRILIPAGGAVVATGLLAAGLAGTAQAAPDWATDPMAKNNAEATSVAQYWTASNNAALKKATAYYHDATPASWKSGGGYSPDGKPGVVAPIGQEKVTPVKVKNINLPKNIGKVFWVDKKGQPKWATATSIQSKYRNLVVTAAHNVYDTQGVGDPGNVLDKWVFVPAYYQGKTPYGIYVGKTAWTHYDFDVYEDYDRDYAFVTVYNGVYFGGDKQVTKSEYNSFVGPKWIEEKAISEAEYKEGYEKYGPEGPFKAKAVDPKIETVAKPANATTWKIVKQYMLGEGPTPGIKLVGAEVVKSVYEAAPSNFDNNAKFIHLSKVVPISQEEYVALLAEKANGKFLGELAEVKGQKGTVIGWTKQQFFVKKWVKSTAQTKYWVDNYFISLSKDAGRLGDNVGGQGFAWNQKTGQPVYVFGYPEGPHPDGDKTYTGITPKWCYGKTSGKVYVSAAQKIEEHIGLRCSMTPGADGAAWLIKYNNNKRLGYVNGVTSQFGDQDGNGRYDLSTSAYFDGETAAIYKKAANAGSGRIVGPHGELLK